MPKRPRDAPLAASARKESGTALATTSLDAIELPRVDDQDLIMKALCAQVRSLEDSRAQADSRQALERVAELEALVRECSHQPWRAREMHEAQAELQRLRAAAPPPAGSASASASSSAHDVSEFQSVFARISKTAAPRPVVAKMQADVVDALLADRGMPLQNATALRGDVCDVCPGDVQMRITANDSLLVCPRCSIARKLSLATAANAGNGNDLDYSSTPAGKQGKCRIVNIVEFTQGIEHKTPKPFVAETVMHFLWSSFQARAPGSGVYVCEPIVLGLTSADSRTEKESGGSEIANGNGNGKGGLACTLALEAHADAIADEVEARGPFLDADDAEARLQESLPCLRAHLRALSYFRLYLAMQGAFEALKKNALPAPPGAGTALEAARVVQASYELAAKVGAALGGYHGVRMTSQQREQLYKLHGELSAALERCSSTHSRLPYRYTYAARQLCLLRGWHEFLPLYPLPRAIGSETLVELEETIAAGFAMLRWEFTPAQTELRDETSARARPDVVVLKKKTQTRYFVAAPLPQLTWITT